MTDQLASLFRTEALEARRTRLEGEVLLWRPLRAQVVVALLTCAIIALAVWVTMGSYARTEAAKGILVTNAEAAKIIALHPGIVTRLAVVEGQHVRDGQMLATVQIDQQYALGDRATAESLSAVEAQRRLTVEQLAAAEQRRQSERASLLATISSSRRQFGEVQSQINIQQELIASLRDTLERYRPVAAMGYISQTEMDRRKQELLTAQQELGRLQQQQTTLQADQTKAVAELRQADAERAAQAATTRSSAEGFRLQEAQLRGQQSYILTSPEAGIVTALQSGVGRTVDAIVPLMTVVPTGATFHAEIYAPSRAIGFVRTGQEVRLLYDAFPYQRFGSFAGHVQAISKVAFDPRQVDAPFHLDEPVYRVSVVPDRQSIGGYGELVRLQPGMTLTANIVLERRSFLGWLLEPIRAVTKRDH